MTTTLPATCRSTTDQNKDGDLSVDDDCADTSRSKRKKTNGECAEEGLRALADGIKSVGDAMKEKASAGADILPSREVVASLTHQDEALKQQTAAINKLIRTLR
ncbi:hypothetical protein L915_11005 [Phytophthora nicotianae]|uniref:Uncharacterized protein n=1 Tax=Phytophthora nicotianae TaxID=4792 RepID=W2IT46_PHYNI|nr:hypothetical protein L915_11005 [Phytophthora nicotianae]ETL37379.1 hypothetical protein L916_10904 [Phytophthora nicotianae]